MKQINELKKWILQNDLEIVDFVLNYIVESKQSDLETTKLAIKAYQKFANDNDSYKLLYQILNLPRDLEILEEILILDGSDHNTVYYKNQIIAQSDLKILKENPHIRPNIDQFNHFLNMRFNYREMETLELWDNLWSFSYNLSKQSTQKHYNQGFLIIDELVQRDDFPFDLLYTKLTEYRNDKPIESDQYFYDHLFLIQLVGRTHYLDGIPYLFDRLKDDDEILNEVVTDNLIYLNHDNVLKTIQYDYSKASREYQDWILTILEKNKSLLSEEILLHLFQQETDLYRKTIIASGLCHQLSTKAIPFIAQFIRDGYDELYTLLEKSIYINCLINEVTHEDLPVWEKVIQVERQRQQERHIAFAHLSRRIQQKKQEPLTNNKIGRNEPCPCGSGKKYKHCCLIK
jgi:SEC-C motif